MSPTTRPNILILMADQMQAASVRPDHPCITPTLDRIAARGVRFENAYTPSPTCGPARASLMTARLPHSHGVVENPHCVPADECNLRYGLPHWAQHLQQAGYQTAYFGKWHVEREPRLERFGWQVNNAMGSEPWEAAAKEILVPEQFVEAHGMDTPPGYHSRIVYGQYQTRPERRGMGVTTHLAEQYLRHQATVDGEQPWCCFVSFQEPHNPYAACPESMDLYDRQAIALPDSLDDDLGDKPGLYRRIAGLWKHWSDRQRRDCSLGYYARITEVDRMFGRLLQIVEQGGLLENTIVVFMADHGQLNWAHGLLSMNVSAFEELYGIPMIIAGPCLAEGQVTTGRVGLHELGPTLLELAGAEPLPETYEARAFTPLLKDPHGQSGNFQDGYAEYFGGRYRLTQRVLWHGRWKFVHNGFDCDELYDLQYDPNEMTNLVQVEAYRSVYHDMVARYWQRLTDTHDKTLYNAHFPTMRLLPIGPLVERD